MPRHQLWSSPAYARLTMAKAHGPRQIQQLLLCPQDLRAQSVSLPRVDAAALATRGNSTGILTAVLENRQGVVDVLDGTTELVGENDGDNSTHCHGGEQRADDEQQ